MANVFDYIKWRGDLSFEVEPFNKLDALILSQLTLIDFSEVFPDEKVQYTMKETLAAYLAVGNKLNDAIGFVISNNVNYLLEALAKSPRYKGIVLRKYRKVFLDDVDLPVQFAAITCDIDDRLSVISFGGTDDTLTGWLEDLMMIYSQVIGGQALASDYLEEALAKNKREFIICGHSKGGNLAMYSILNYEGKLKRIKRVYNFDGPGVPEEQYNLPEFEEKWKKIHAYLPYKATIGRLFYHQERTKIVYSAADIFYQHDPFSWQLMGKEFIYMKKLGDESIYLEHKLKQILGDMTAEDQKLFVASVVKLMQLCGAKTLTELAKNKSKMLLAMMKMQKEERANVNRILIKGLLGDRLTAKMLVNNYFDKKNFKLTAEERAKLLGEAPEVAETLEVLEVDSDSETK